MKITPSKNGVVVGILFALFFVVCMAWGMILKAPELIELHQQLLVLSYPGFSFSLTGLIIGLMESFVYGWLLGAGYGWIKEKIAK